MNDPKMLLKPMHFDDSYHLKGEYIYLNGEGIEDGDCTVCLKSHGQLFLSINMGGY